MKWFKKKTTVNKEQDENKNEINKAEYNIMLLEKLGGTVRVIKSFNAQRWIDEEDKVVYLKNDKLNFLEIFPQQENDFKSYTETEVDDLIKKHQKSLEQERHQDSDNINDKDLEYQLLKLKAKKRSFKFDSNSSYLSFNEKAQPTFYFIREGSTFFPLKWDTETKNIFVPSDNRKKTARLVLANKENKYNTNKIVTGAAIIMLLIGFAVLILSGYGLIKVNKMEKELFQAYDESNIAEAQRRSLEVANQCGATIEQSANTIARIVQDIDSELNKEQTVIEGIVPE